MVSRSVNTLQRWDREGVLVAHRNSQNRRYYTHDQYLSYIGQKPDIDVTHIVVYSRVSRAAQKTDLHNQIKALELFCSAKGYAVEQ